MQRWIAAGALALLALGPTRAGEIAPLPRPALGAAIDPRAAADLFAMPAIAAETRAAFETIRAGDLDGAADRLERLARRHPDLGGLQVNRAALAMLQDDPEAALAHLAAAAGHTPDLAATLADPVFAPLAEDPAHAPALAALLAAPAPDPAPPPVPAPVVNGEALVSAANTAWDPAAERLVARFAFPDAATAPVLPARKRVGANEILREHFRRGRAAGNNGDLYDNRDRGHSALKPEDHPQLAHVVYEPAARAADLDYGLVDRMLFDRPTLGNSSTAITRGLFWRSLPRQALTLSDGTGPMRLWQNATANHLYVYPAHKDFTEERGDLFPANTPYVLVSRGSSGSDRPFLEALAMTLAAFPPETKARLVEERMLVPTVQMVFRRSLQSVRSREAYFSSAAHLAAFEGFDLNSARMVSLANSIAPDAIPAEVRIRVVEEELGVEGVDYFGQGLTETFFDTPGAIARIWRSKAWRRSMLVSAEDSRDVNGRPLAFEWRLLQGDPERVTIEPLGDGSRARITLDWHDPFKISKEVPLTTSRVDIGVFASNGVHDSAPAILSWYFPPNQTRIWEPGPDGAPRIAAIDHADPAKAEVYADPLLLPRADWRDEYAYGAGGTLTGWTRIREGRTDGFTADGHRLLDPAAGTAGARREAVVHVLARRPEGGLVVEERSDSTRFR